MANDQRPGCDANPQELADAIREAVGAENVFLFGLTADEVRARRAAGYERRKHYSVVADFAAYSACQERVAATFVDRKRRDRMLVLNAARVGGFSSDRSIREYAERIWHVPIPNGSSRVGAQS